MALVRKMVDRIVVLDSGEVVEAGPSERVSVRPASATAQRLVEAAPSLIMASTRTHPSTPVDEWSNS